MLFRSSKDSFISGTAYFNNVVVYGTSSIQYITSSQLVVGANMIYLNTQTPAVRFGGMAVADSGSAAGVTGSMLWDSVNNNWIYVQASGSTYSGGALISGPRNLGTVGSEQTTTACYIMAGQGGDHITSSVIYTDSAVTCIPNTLIGSTICTTMANASCVGIATTSPSAFLYIGTYASSGKYIDSVSIPNTPSNYLVTLTPPSTTNSYGGGIGWSEGTNVAAAINAFDDGATGALGLSVSTGTNSGL